MLVFYVINFNKFLQFDKIKATRYNKDDVHR